MIEVREAERRTRTAVRRVQGYAPPGKFLIFNSLKHVFLPFRGYIWGRAGAKKD
jgi:hypothetical protein